MEEGKPASTVAMAPRFVVQWRKFGGAVMGNHFLAYYRERVKLSWKVAFLSVFLVGLLAHLYKFTNYLPDRDSLLNIYHDQNTLASGRWALSFACGISSYFDLPMVNGLLSLVYMGLTMVVMVELFRLENPVLIALGGGLLAAFPGTTETFLYEYTADGYFLAMLLAAIGVYATRMAAKGARGYVLGGCCLCVSCAIYQSYVSFALVLALFHFCWELLEGRHQWRECLRWAGKQAALYILSMAAYYGIWKLLLAVNHTQANDYQGISEIGTNVLSTMVSAIPASVKAVVSFFLQWNVLKMGFTPYILLNLAFLVAAAEILVVSVLRSGMYRQGWRLACFLLALVLVIPASCIWSFASAFILYRPMMLLCLAVVYLFVFALIDRWAKPRWADVAGVLAVAILFNFILIANITYHYLTRSYERTYAMGIQLALDIRDMEKTEDFSRFAVAGDGWLEDTLAVYDYEKDCQTQASGIGILSRYLYNDLLFDHDRITAFLTEYIGVDLQVASWTSDLQEKAAPLLETMPCWPEVGSMIVVDDTLIIKIAD